MIKKHDGFTLVEIMMGLGVSSILILSVMQIMNKTKLSSRLAEQEEQVNSLVFTAMSMLNRKASCDFSLVNADTTVPDFVINNIRNRNNNIVLSVGSVRGTGASRIEVTNMRLTDFETGDFQGSNRATFILTLKRASAIGVDLTTISIAERARLSAREGTTRLQIEHKIPVSVLTDAAGLVTECDYTVFSLEDDLDKACGLFAGTMVGDKCHNISVNAADPAARLGTSSIGAEVFANGDMTQYSTGATFTNTSVLETDTSLTPALDADPELLRVNSLTTRSMSLGTELIPAQTGYLNTSGDVLVGGTATMPGGTQGMYVEGSLEAGGVMTLLDPINPTGAADNNLVISADWAASQIADTMASSGVDIDDIKNNILAGGTEVATNAIFEYICENIYFQRINFANGAGRASTELETVPGFWDGSRCILEATFKRNCSNPGECNTIATNQLCLGGTCMTRWPYVIKSGGCSWTNSCSGSGRRIFGRTNNPLSPGSLLCCGVRMSDVNL